METTTARLTESIEKFRADPGSGVTNPTVSATVLNGHARLSSGSFNWESDLGPAVGGGNVAPSPTAYLLGALAGCGVIFLRDTLAPEFDVELAHVEATASCRSDLGGLPGIEGASPALADISLSLRLSSPDPSERVEAMLGAWRERCPIYLALLTPNPVALDVRATS